MSFVPNGERVFGVRYKINKKKNANLGSFKHNDDQDALFIIRAYKESDENRLRRLRSYYPLYISTTILLHI